MPSRPVDIIVTMSAPTPRRAGGGRPRDRAAGGQHPATTRPARRRPRPPPGVLVRRWAVALTVVALSIDLAARAVQHLAAGSDRAAAAPAHVKGGAGLAEAAAGPALSGPALRWGMHGRAVEALQAALSLIGYDPGRP